MYSFAIDPQLASALKVVKDRDGISESEQIRRALKQWFEREGVGTHAHKAAWDEWMERFRSAKDKSVMVIPATVSRTLEGRSIGDLSEDEEEVITHIATAVGREPDLNILRAKISVRRAVKRSRIPSRGVGRGTA
jgi:hypothetical protein